MCIIAGQFLVPRIFPWGEPVVSEKCGSDGVLPATYRGHLRRQHLHGQNPAIRHRLPGSSRNRPPPHRNPSGVPHVAGDNCSTHSTVLCTTTISLKIRRRGQCTGSPSGSTWPSSGPTTRCGSARPPPSPSHIGTR